MINILLSDLKLLTGTVYVRIPRKKYSRNKKTLSISFNTYAHTCADTKYFSNKKKYIYLFISIQKFCGRNFVLVKLNRNVISR